MFAACLLAAGVSGCAFTQVNIRPPAPEELIPTSVVGRARAVSVDVPFDDQRLDRSRCGTQKNGYNTETAPVVCQVPPETWLASALMQGLERSGFHAVANSPWGPATVRIHGELQQFFVEPKLNVFTFEPEADIAVRLVVTSASGLNAERRFYFKGVKPALLGTEDQFQAASRMATQAAVQAMVQAIVSLLDRYPALGTTSPTGQVSVAYGHGLP